MRAYLGLLRWVCRTHLFQFNGTSPETSPKRIGIGHTDKYDVTVFGESVLLAERDEVQRVAEAHAGSPRWVNASATCGRDSSA